MQSENKKEDQGYIISLVLTTTCFPAYFFLIFLLMFLPFHNTPKFMVYVKNTRDFSHRMNWHTYV